VSKRPLAARSTTPDYQALAAFRYALRRFLSFSAGEARASGLSPQQHQALLAIKGFPGKGPVSVGQLAERLDLRHHSAVGLVNRLVRGRLVRRAADTGDRRRIHVMLTTRGEALLERLASVHSSELRRLGPELRRLLRKLR
jgi:DNA-binding MarR family transcriptional regulator